MIMVGGCVSYQINELSNLVIYPWFVIMNLVLENDIQYTMKLQSLFYANRQKPLCQCYHCYLLSPTSQTEYVSIFLCGVLYYTVKLTVRRNLKKHYNIA